MPKYNSFEDMPVWQKSMQLAEDVHRISSTLPKSEDYGLTSQIRRSALSISANLAEGFGRGTSKDKANFYRYSRGSALETKNHLIYGCRVKYFNENEISSFFREIEEIIFEINKILKFLNNQH